MNDILYIFEVIKNQCNNLLKLIAMSKKVRQKVYVGMSGGVDSSVTAALLKQQDYDVVGVYMKNWSQDLPGLPCPWREDYQDAKRVAIQLGIDFKMYDFEAEYKQKVVQYMIDEYKSGRTPNPDVMCNQEIKFKLFFEVALADGADFIATGHYAKVVEGGLAVAENIDKDQTYFLYRVINKALLRTLMPLGHYKSKNEIREIAKGLGLVTATKKDSQGICFVGKIGIRDFLSQYVTTKKGLIKDINGISIGEHDGAIYYTIGQRHGLNVGGGLPYYVVGKNMDKNEVYVTTNIDDNNLWKSELNLVNLHWINERPTIGKNFYVRTRYRAPLVKATLNSVQDVGGDHSVPVIKLALQEKVRAVTPGQSAVIYDNNFVLGGGIII